MKRLRVSHERSMQGHAEGEEIAVKKSDEMLNRINGSH
jgi:hypothetical protein